MHKFLSLIFKLKFQMFQTTILLKYILLKINFITINLLSTLLKDKEGRERKEFVRTAFIFNLTTRLLEHTWMFLSKKNLDQNDRRIFEYLIGNLITNIR